MHDRISIDMKLYAAPNSLLNISWTFWGLRFSITATKTQTLFLSIAISFYWNAYFSLFVSVSIGRE